MAPSRLLLEGLIMTDSITIRISPDLDKALDRFLAADVAPFRSRQDAFRHIASTWLTDEGYIVASSPALGAPEGQRGRRRLSSSAAMRG